MYYRQISKTSNRRQPGKETGDINALFLTSAQ